MSANTARDSGDRASYPARTTNALQHALEFMACKVQRVVICAVCGFLLCAFAMDRDARAQVPAPLPQPNVPLYLGGTVHAVAAQSDGSIVFGGAFSSVNGVARNNIARLLPDGTLDTIWNPSANDTVLALAVDAGGDIYAGGLFTAIGGHARASIAKLAGDGAGAADATWDPAADGSVTALAVDANGAVYAGGEFTHAGGLARNFIAKLAGTGTGAADAVWNASADGPVATLAVSAGGAVYAGGGFAHIGGQARAFIAKLSGSSAGAADLNWNPSSNGAVQSLALATGNVFAGGAFSAIGGQPRSHLAKLSDSGTGAADAVWNPGADNTVLAMTLDAGGALYAGGAFTNIGAQHRRFIAKLSAAGIPDPSWDPSVNGIVRTLVPGGSGALYIGGGFTRAATGVRLGFAALAPTGVARTTVTDAELPGQVYALIEQPAGGSIIGGNFEKAGQVARSNLLRLLADGTLDANWDLPANAYVLTMVLGADDAVYLGGYFSAIGSAQRNSLAKLTGTGNAVLDANWKPSANEIVRALAVGTDGAVFAGGRFTSIDGQPRGYIAKLAGNGTGAVDAQWNPAADAAIAALAVDASDAIYVGGEFTHIGGQARNNIAKLAADGAGLADSNWNPAANNFISALALGADASVYAGGAFTSIGGQPRSNIAKLTASGGGTADPSWNPGSNGVVQALALSANGSVFAAGAFSSIGVQTRHNIAKLSGTGTGAVDADWNPAADDSVLALRVYANGAIHVGGEFNTVGGLARLGLAALPPVATPVVDTATTITNVTPSTSVVGQGYAVAFIVSAASGSPSGSVLVRDNAGVSCGPTTLVSGAGTCSLASMVAGTLTLAASYLPDDAGAFYASSGTTTHIVGPADTTLAITAHTPDPSTPTQAVTTTVALAVSSPGTGTPGGSIAVGDGVDTCTIAQGDSSCMLTLTTRGTRTLTAAYAGDGNFNASSTGTIHHVNELPIATGDSYQTNEDMTLAVPAAQGVVANDSDPDNGALSVANAGTLTAAGIGGVVHISASGAFDYTPPANANGTASFSYTVSDGLEASSGTVTIAVGAVNDPPSFTLATNPAWPAGTVGAQSAPGFATVSNFGPPDEGTQHVQAWIVRTIQDPNAISTGVGISLGGALGYTLTGRTGTATFGVKLQDDGGTANGGSDTSIEQTFTITVAAGANLSASIDDGVTFVAGGHAATYVVTAHNNGPDDVIGALVQDALPANLVSATWSCVASAGASCSSSGAGGIHDTVSIPNGGALTYTLTATALPIPEQPIVNTVSITAPAGMPDPNTANNTATDVDAVGIFANGFDGGA